VLELWDALGGAMSSWYDAKLFLEHGVSVSNDALHVVLGVLVQLIAGLLLRRPISSLTPWLVALALTVWNETVDLSSEHWPNAAMQYGESAKDLALTMLLPTALLLAARLRPDLFRRGSKKHGRR
jgi:hypothetical protein